LFGNYSGSASSDEAQRSGGIGRNSPAVSRYFDIPFMSFNLDGDPDDGLLPTDRPHFAKVAANYQFGWFGSKSNTTDLNAFFQIGSGTPVTTRARYAVVSGQIVGERGDLGRTETLSQLDLSLTHKYRFGTEGRYAVALDFNVLNVLNQAAELSRRETLIRSNLSPSLVGCATVAAGDTPLRCMTRAVFNGAVTSAFLYNFGAVTANRDLRYNSPQLFQDPRAIRFGFRFLF